MRLIVALASVVLSGCQAVAGLQERQTDASSGGGGDGGDGGGGGGGGVSEACSGHAAPAAVERVLDMLDTPREMKADGPYLYYLVGADGIIERFQPAEASPMPEVFTTGTLTIRRFAVASGFVAWWERDTGSAQLRYRTKNDPAVMTFTNVAGTENGPGLAAHGQRAYLGAKSSSSPVLRSFSPREATVTHANELEGVDELAIDGADLYAAHAGGIARFSPTATVMGEPIVSNPNAMALAIDGDFLYWSVEREIHRMARAGGNAEQIISARASVQQLIPVGSCVIWLDANGNIDIAPRDGGAPQGIASEPALPNAITIVGDELYFSAGDDLGFIGRVPLP